MLSPNENIPITTAKHKYPPREGHWEPTTKARDALQTPATSPLIIAWVRGDIWWMFAVKLLSNPQHTQDNTTKKPPRLEVPPFSKTKSPPARTIPKAPTQSFTCKRSLLKR